MKILIITPYYLPDLGPSAPLFGLLSNEFVKLGHEVTVVSAVPHYPSGIVNPEYRKKIIRNSVEKNIRVFRIGVPSLNRTIHFNRLCQFICYQFGAAWVSLKQKIDVIIITNPALETWLPLICMAGIRKKPIIYSVFDLYPDVGIKLGIFRNKHVINQVTKFECCCLKMATIIQIISNSFIPGLRELGVKESKLDLVNIWVDTELIKPQLRNNLFSQENNLIGKFVVLYAGNIGHSQGLENILLAGQLLENHDDIRFVFVGAGSGLEHLKNQSSQMLLKNVQFIPFQPRERLPEVLASADVSLVVLKRGIGVDSLPSKTFSILASGRPIIASVDEESETWNLVKKAEAGLCVPPEDPEKIAKAILSLKNNKEFRENLGKNGRAWAEKYHSPQYAAEQFEKLCQKAITIHKQK